MVAAAQRFAVSKLRTRGLPPGSALLAAHPDDETIGAGALLCRSPRVRVLHLTDGAPRDSRLWPRAFPGGRDEYAALRRRETELALAIAGIPADRIDCLGGIDQEAIEHAAQLARSLADRLRALRPPVLVIHPLEGGHPDHDAAALVARAAAALLGTAAPALVEMTSYHARGDGIAAAKFLPAPGRAVELPVRGEIRERKQGMIAAYATQSAVLKDFPIDAELFRDAPAAHFGQQPHEGQLHYERMGWRRGDEWRSLARAALEELGLWEQLR
jgi:LmbE family N-acetylglucosaminyl deacetylase